MTVVQREVLAALQEANRRLVLARVGSQSRSRFTGKSTPLVIAIGHRNRMIRLALEAGISIQTIADECGIAGTRRVRQIAGSPA